MPYPNEHSARLKSPDMSHIRVRRTKGGKLYGKKVPATIGIIWYITKKNGKEIPIAQSLRFPIKSWTVAKAKKWLKDNEIKYIKFEAAVPEKVKKNLEEIQVVLKEIGEMINGKEEDYIKES